LDVTHPSPNSIKNAPSIAAAVSNVDEDLATWIGRFRPQASRVEMVQGLREMIRDLLVEWKNNHGGELPTKILIFRDGVSEGQYQMVLRDEFGLIRDACMDKQLYGHPDKFPKVSIVVGSRITNVFEKLSD
jgi:eukaryotic translation initiation factor 2C